MRPAYTIDLEHGCIFVKWSGVVTAHDIVAFNLELARDPEYRSGLNRLVDLRGVNFEASSDEIEGMATETIKSRDTIEGRRKGAMLVGRRRSAIHLNSCVSASAVSGHSNGWSIGPE